MATGIIEVIGGVEALAQLSMLSYGISRRLWRCKKALTHAKADISRVYNVVRNFELILGAVYELELKATRNGCGLSGGSKCSLLMKRLNNACEHDFKNIRQILSSVKPLRADKVYSKFHRWKAFAKWHFLHKEDVDRLLVSLRSSSHSLNMVLHLVNCRQLMKIINQLNLTKKDVSVELKEELARCKKNIKDLEADCEEAKQECEQLRLISKHQQQDIACLDFMDTVKQLVTLEIREVARCQATLHQNPPTMVFSPPSSRPLPSPTVNFVEAQNADSNTAVNQASVFSSFEAVPSPTRTKVGKQSCSGFETSTTGIPEEAVAPSRGFPGAYMPTIGLPILQQKPKNPRAPSPEAEIGPVVVDHNDGGEPQTEYRRPRKPRF